MVHILETVSTAVSYLNKNSSMVKKKGCAFLILFLIAATHEIEI